MFGENWVIADLPISKISLTRGAVQSTTEHNFVNSAFPCVWGIGFFFFSCTRACDPVYLEMKAIPDFKYLNVQLDPQVSSFCVIWYMRKKRKVLFSSQGLIRFEDSLWCLIHECAGLNLWSIYKVCVQSQLRFCSKGKILSMFCRETCLQQKPLNMLLFYAKPILCVY